jgi:predicted RND superfamily exporter protein
VDPVLFGIGAGRLLALPSAPRSAGRFVGPATAIASIMLSVGFNVMNPSEFATLRQFGYLSGASLAVCLLTDLWLLPAILVATRA